MIKQFNFQQFNLTKVEDKWYQVLQCMTNNSIKHQLFAYTQLNDQRVLFLIIKFDTSRLFAPSINVKQLYLTHW